MTSANNTPTLPSFAPSTTYNRRPSYANVAAGLNPSRFNTLAAFGAGQSQNRSEASLQQQQQRQRQSPPMSRQRSRSSLRSMEIDGGSGGWKRPASSWSNHGFDPRLGCAIHEDHGPFFTPSYLRQSRHVQRLQRAYEEHLAELQDLAQMAAPPRQPSLSTSSSSANLGKMHAQHLHRAPVQDVIERIPLPAEEDKSHPLPSRWSDEDKMTGLEVTNEGREVRFNGHTKSQDEAASVRADHHMPREVGLYYYEVTVISKHRDSLIGVGFSGRQVPLTRLPGWEVNSWAYHGDDGFIFSGHATGKTYAQKFGANDVVGCGVNFRTGEAFFTRNGVHLGVAFSGIREPRLYPSVGMKKPGENVLTNFGRTPFIFDIERMMEEERQIVLNDIRLSDPRSLHPPDDEEALIHKLVGQYLAHEGYIETAKAFAKDVQDQQDVFSSPARSFHLPDSDDDNHAWQRQKVRKSILDGDIDKAFKYMGVFYPRVLNEERNRDIHFRLRCREFIEMMRRYTEGEGRSSSPTTLTKSVDSLGTNGRVEDRDMKDTQMELDDQLNREASNGLLPPPAANDVDMDSSPDPRPKASSASQLAAALAYGRELQSTFGADPRQQIKKQLENIFAIMAYTNPSESVVGQLLDPRGRVQIAEDLNGAILVSLGKPPSAALEKVCAQTEALLDEMAPRGGAAAFVNVRAQFLRP